MAMEPEKKEEPERQELRQDLVRLLVKITAVLGILWAVFTFVLGIHINTGNRMAPYLLDGDLVITYKLEEYHIGDVAAYRDPGTGAVRFSRIIAIGPNEIRISERGELRVNDVIPDEKVFYPTTALEGSAISFPYRMSDEGYFLLDDYRTEGRDSRMFGELNKKDLLGKVVWLFRRRGF